MNFNFNELILIIEIYAVIHYLIFCIFLWFIFKKENIKCFFSIIPFVNYYYYFKICKIPFWTFFIPIVNVIVILFMTYRISYQFGFKRNLCWLSIFVPLIFLGIIAFSNRKNRDKTVNTVYVKNTKDIDELEDHLLKEINNDDYKDKIKIKQADEVLEKKNNFIDNIEKNIKNDEYVYEEKEEAKIVDVLKDESDNLDIVELEDEDYVLSMDKIDDIESNVNNNFKVDKTINKNVVEYNIKDVNDKDIAFGGKEEVDVISKAKKDELVCERCGSSLVGANGICPGCGAKL